MLFRKKYVLRNHGHCPICEQDVIFKSKEAWLRDHYFCSQCWSIPRERALMDTINKFFPEWRNARVHESSPGNRGVSDRLQKECHNHVASQYYPDVRSGMMHDGFQSENLEQLSFADESIDLHITQDVMEHIFDPAAAFSEIARTLKSGGMHIFTVPLVNKLQPTTQRAKMEADGTVTHLMDEYYHGNPIGDGRSLVTYDWGFDICDYIFKHSNLFTYTICIDDIDKGIRAEYIEVLVTVKPH